MGDNCLCWVIICQSRGIWNVAPFKALFLSHFPCCKYEVSWWDHYWTQDRVLPLCWWCKIYFSGLVAAGTAPWEILKDTVNGMHQELFIPKPEKIHALGRGHTPQEGTQKSPAYHHTAYANRAFFIIFIQLHYSKTPPQDSWWLSHYSCTLSQCDGLLWHIMSTQQIFCISCCLLFLNLSPGFTLAIFKNYSLSSKLVCLCVHTPPTVESFYHWIWSQLDSLILLWQPSRIKFLLHHICSHLSIPSVTNLDWKYASTFLVLTLRYNTE